MCDKHGYNILLDTNLKPWVFVTNMDMTYYWIPTSNCEYQSQTWVQYTTGHQSQTVSICDKHWYNILLDMNLKPWVSVTNMSMTYNWIPASSHEYLSQTLPWHTTRYQPQTLSICHKHGYDILLDTNLKLWVSVTNMGMIYYWIPTWKCEYKSQTWIWHTTGYQPQTMSICHKDGYDILQDTNLKPWVSVTNIGMTYYWIPTSNREYLSQRWVRHTTGYQPQTMSICHKHWYEIRLNTNLKPWVSVTNMGILW